MLDSVLIEIVALVVALLFLLRLARRNSIKSPSPTLTTSHSLQAHVGEASSSSNILPNNDSHREQLTSLIEGARRLNSIDFSSLDLHVLPEELATELAHVEAVKFKFTRTMAPPDILLRLPKLRQVTIVGTSLTTSAVNVLRSLPEFV
jgi:hypothetical protein